MPHAGQEHKKSLHPAKLVEWCFGTWVHMLYLFECNI
jgi:hypothetical protein